MATRDILLPMVHKFFELDPAAAAHSLETMNSEDAVSVLRALPTSISANAVSHLPHSLAADLMIQLPMERFKDILERLTVQQRADIFRRLAPDDRQKFLENLDEKNKEQIREFLTYPEGSAGQIMGTDFLAFHTDVKVKEAIQKIRALAHRGFPASYIYSVDKDNHLVGVINMRDLMLAPSDATLDTIMRTNIFSVNAFMDREQVANELSIRRFFAVPVVDANNGLLGVVKAEHLLDDVQEEATEDMQKMFGAGGDERSFSPISFSIRKRLPWLYVNLGTAFLAALVVGIFEGIIAKITVLAVFLPVVAGQGGNAGAQSLAVVMRGLVMREISPKNVKRLILKETLIGIINGVLVGTVTALITYLWHGNPYLGLVIGLGMLVNLVMAGFSGAAIPIFMKAIGLDPAQCSNIILTTITDVMGFFSFLGFAVIFQNYLS